MDLSSDINKLCTGCMEKVENKEIPCPHCGWLDSTTTQANHQLSPQTILNGKYLTGRVLGEGGFGITYLGWDLNLDMKVAIKEYYPTGFVTRETTTTAVTPFSGDKRDIYQNGLDKFLIEAKSLAKFYNYPGIVSVKDFFKENGTAYIVMEYVDGITLKQYFVNQGGKMPASTVFDLVKPLMSSLSQMHKSGIIHRDISPDNLMLTPEGTLKLLDFGAARAISSDGAKSLSVILKPGYAPEEQYRTRGIQGPWTDVYALCATIYKAITGETPPEALDRLHEDTLVPPSQKGAIISPPMEAALLKGMSVIQKDRYDSIASLYNALYGENQNSSPLLKDQSGIIDSSNTATSSDGANTVNGNDKTVPLNNGSEKTMASSHPAASAPVRAPVTKFSKGTGIIFLVLFSIVSILLKNYEADLFLWAIAAINIGYCAFGMVRNSHTSSLEKALAAGVRSGLVILLTVIYLGDNSRAFGYGGDPDPGFALGYGASLVMMAFLLVTAAYDILGLISAYKKSDGLSEAQKKQTRIYRTSGISVFALALFILAGTLLPLIDDVQQTVAIREKEKEDLQNSPEPSPSLPAESITPEPIESESPEPSPSAPSSPTLVEIGSPLAPAGVAPSDPSITGNTNPGHLSWNDDVFCYKMNLEDKETLQISNWDLSDTRILVSESNTLYTPQVYGDWVYYHTQPGIYRIRPDGSGQELLADTYARSFLVYDDKIYYTADDQGVFVMNLDGSDVKQLCEEEYSFIQDIRDNLLFYANRDSVKAVSLDGSDQALLTQKYAYQAAFYKGDLFYTNGTELYRIRLQEGNKEEYIPADNVANFKIYKDRIYYFDLEAECIKSCNLDGSDSRIISRYVRENDQKYINIDAVTDDWIYYSNGTCEFSRRMTHDGTLKQNIGIYN